MGNYIFTKEERNDFKIAMALVQQEEVSWLLRRIKIQEICLMLEYGDEEDIEIFDQWVETVEGLLDDGNIYGFRKYIFLELLYLEAYLEIVDFGLDSFKIEQKV